MRITIMALGSRGDVQPYAALGVGLQQVGYAVRVATFENFRPFIEKLGLDFHPVKGDAEQLVTSVSGKDMMQSGNPLVFMRNLMKTFGSVVDDYIAAFSSEALADSGAIINQIPSAYFGSDVAEKLKVPHIVAAVIPVTTTREFPLSLLTTRSFGPLNRSTYMMGHALGWAAFRGPVQRFRQKLGLQPISFVYQQKRWESYPTINGFSRHVVPVPADWGANVHTTGYWTVDEDDWTPPADLVEFLEAGEPPVFVGFGSMPIPDPAATTREVVTALQMAGARGVLSSGWAKLGDVSLPETVRLVDYVPYGWLLPRMAMVVHHGGSGTTGLALRSGVPSLIVPFAADQPYWGKRIHDLGVAPAPVPFRTLTADALAAAIRRGMNERGMRVRAANLGEKLCAEDGIQTAVGVVQRLLNH